MLSFESSRIIAKNPIATITQTANGKAIAKPTFKIKEKINATTNITAIEAIETKIEVRFFITESLNWFVYYYNKEIE